MPHHMTVLTPSHDPALLCSSSQVRAISAMADERKEILFGVGGTNSSGAGKGSKDKAAAAAAAAPLVRDPKGGNGEQGGENSKREVKELVYISHIRIGDINSRVSLSGFAIDTDKYGLRVPAFTRSQKVGSWKYLIKKWVSHLVREVTKSAMGTGVTKFKEKVFGAGGSKPSDMNASRSFIEGTVRSPSSTAGSDTKSPNEAGEVDKSLIFGVGGGQKEKKSKWKRVFKGWKSK